MKSAGKKKTLCVAVGSAFVAGMAATPLANAADNPFSLHSLQRGYMVADAKVPAGKCGQGKCGAMKTTEARCGAGMMDTNKDGKISRDEFMKAHAAMYGPTDGNKAQFMKAHEAVFTAKDLNKDGYLDPTEEKVAAEGKCGQGKCGAMPKK